MEINKSALPQDVQQYISELEAKIAKANPNPEPSPEDVLKGLDPAMRQVVEGIKKRADEAEARAKVAEEVAKAEKDRRVLDEYVAKARAYGDIPGTTAEELGAVLKRLAETNPDESTKLDGVLKSAGAAIAQSKLFEEIGKGDQGMAGGAWTKIEKAAEEIRKANPALTQAQAIEKVGEVNPALFAEYRKEAK